MTDNQMGDDAEVHQIIQEILNHITYINHTPTSREENFNLGGMMDTVRRLTAAKHGESEKVRVLREALEKIRDHWGAEGETEIVRGQSDMRASASQRHIAAQALSQTSNETTGGE